MPKVTVLYQLYQSSRRSRLVLVAIVVVVVASGLLAGIARAVFPNDSVTSYAGCLTTSAGHGGVAGQISDVAVGDTSLAACASNETLVHLSGGDITSVNAGTGLAGGGANGATTLGLSSTYALPQGCADGHVPKWTASSSTWGCAADSNSGGTISGVTAGTGLTGGGSSGSVALGLGSGFQLPQGCSNGQVAKANGGNWGCADDNSGAASAGPHVYYNRIDEGFDSSRGIEFARSPAMPSVLTLNLAAGSYLVQARMHVIWGTDIFYVIGPFLDVECQLDGPGGVIVKDGITWSGNTADVEIPLEGVVTLSSAGSIHLECDYGSAGEPTVGANTYMTPIQRSITAISVGAIN